MSVLHVWGAVGFKIEHAVPRENHGFAPINIHQGVTDGADPYEVGDFPLLLIRQLRRTLRNLFESPLNRFVQHFVECDVVSSAAAHLVPWERNQIVSKMHEALRL